MDKFTIDDHEKLWMCLDIVNERMLLEDIFREWGYELKRSSGKFLWKVRCPLPGHVGKSSDGSERTPSFCISPDNRFYCFGCGGFGSAVDLVSLVQGIPQIEVVRQFAMRLGLIDKDGVWDEDFLSSIPKIKKEAIDPEKTVEPHILRACSSLRKHIRSYLEDSDRFEAEFSWAEKVGSRIDELLRHIGYEDWEYARDLHEKVVSSINRRKRRSG